LLAQPMDVYPIVGAASAEEIKEIAAVEAIRLTPEQCAYLEGPGA